jgi:hypothetical protein
VPISEAPCGGAEIEKLFSDRRSEAASVAKPGLAAPVDLAGRGARQLYIGSFDADRAVPAPIPRQGAGAGGTRHNGGTGMCKHEVSIKGRAVKPSRSQHCRSPASGMRIKPVSPVVPSRRVSSAVLASTANVRGELR